MLEYAALVWDLHQQNGIQSIEKVQHRVANAELAALQISSKDNFS